MNDDKLQTLTGEIQVSASGLILVEDDGLPWLLDCDPRLARHVEQRVTIEGYAYSECRFSVCRMVET